MERQGHCLRKGTRRMEGRSALGALLLLVVLSLVGWVYLAQAGQTASLTYRLEELEEARARLQRENAYLRFKIAQLESVARLEARARELGFVPVQRPQYVVVTVPSGQVAATSPQEETPATELLTLARWWDSLASQFVAWAGEGR